MKKIFLGGLLISFTSCHHENTTDKTKRSSLSLTKKESFIKLPIRRNFQFYSYFVDDTSEYFTCKISDWIYLTRLTDCKIIDSISIFLSKEDLNKYGYISSYCFSGKDSLFVLLHNAVLFYNKKILKRIIPINDLDTLQYHSIRFADLENAPIYFDKKKKEIIGQVYCMTCGQSNAQFYKQKILGGISLEDSKIRLYNITYPEMYIKNYFGFANHVYMDNNDSLTLISLPCDPKMYLYNRNTNTEDLVWSKSIFQSRQAQTLDTSFANNVEEKVKHMITVPYYTEIRFDKYRNLYYRFFLKELPIKRNDGLYNTFNDKELILMVLNSQYEVAGEFELNKYYNNFISFVGKDGLYINYFSKNPADSDKKVFSLLTFH